MLEEIIATMPLWQKVLGYVFILLGLFIYVKTSKLRVAGRQLIPLRWRIAVSLFFPLIFALAIVFGALIIGFLLITLTLGILFSILTGRKPKLPKFGRIKINIVRK